MKFFKNKMFMLMSPADDNNAGGSGGGEGGADDKNKDGGDGGNGGAGTGDQGDKDKDKNLDGKVDITKLDPNVQKIIKDLRSENAKYRTEGKKSADRLSNVEKALKKLTGDDSEDEAPEKTIEKLSSSNGALQLRSTMLEIAVENGIGKDDFEYFEFLMTKELNALEDDAEMSEEQVAEVIKKVGANKQKAPANSSVDDKQKEKNKGGGDSGEVTLEAFLKMGMMAKTELFKSKPDLYNSLVAQAKQKGLL